MEAAESQRIEARIRERFDAGDLREAATVALRGYGPEIFGVLISLHRDESHAAEVFSVFTERMWRGLPGFAWASSFRTWAYTIARNASRNHVAEQRVRAAVVPLPSGSELDGLVEQIRTETLSHLQSRVKDGFTRLREALAPDDQLLLVLRFDKEMAWGDIARVLNEGEAPLDPAAEKRESARLRQRCQTLKRLLLERAREAGLV
ncbi:MAG: sigma-70 family RNA polymerase sigma factor [Myxococcales bacterium]|nr:sigma-70 family RNA polymerase sigma factor [Myxococcales bacterium]